VDFDTLKASELETVGIADKAVIVPLGAFEQHGHHLPFSTDTTIAEAIARRVEEALPKDVLLLRPLWLGRSNQHAVFGTISLDTRTYVDVLKGMCRSLVSMGARKILLISGHGGNEIPGKMALVELKPEFSHLDDLHIVYASHWRFDQELVDAETDEHLRGSNGGRLDSGIDHAGDIETSLMLYLAEETVDMTQVTQGGSRSGSDYKRCRILNKGYPIYFTIHADEWSESGVNGIPASASKASGKRLFDGLTRKIVEFVRDFLTW